MHPEWRSVNTRSIRLMEAGRMDNAGLDFMIQTLVEKDLECKFCMTKKQARCSSCYTLTYGSCRKSEEKCAGCELVYIEAEKKDEKVGKMNRRDKIANAKPNEKAAVADDTIDRLCTGASRQ